jgi:hypothetical protein
MRDRAMGVLFILSGLCFVVGVANPPLLSTWGASVPEALRTDSAHRTAWFLSTWLIALSVAAGVAAVELLFLNSWRSSRSASRPWCTRPHQRRPRRAPYRPTWLLVTDLTALT